MGRPGRVSLRASGSLGLASVALAACVGLAPGTAHAFRDHLTFEGEPIDGGGGERWFTGSIRDGHTCGVCHTGGPPLDEVEFEGLPAAGYRPGESYELTLTLPRPTNAAGDTVFNDASASFELTDAAGDALGTFTLPDDPGPEDECDPAVLDLGPASVFVVERADGRIIVTSDACKASRIRVTWNAPVSRTPVFLAAAVVGAGAIETPGQPGAGRPAGDTAVSLYRQIQVAGEPVEGGPRVTAGCAVSPVPRSGAWLLGLLAAIAGSRARRRGAR